MRLIFVIPDRSLWGSTIMRGIQLHKIAKRYLQEDFDCEIMRMPWYGGQSLLRQAETFTRQIPWIATRPRDAIYVVTKQCLYGFNPVAAEILQWRSRGVIFDYVDADMATISMRGADVHLCASHAQFDYLRKINNTADSSTIGLVHHGYDLRLRERRNGLNVFRSVYWGAARNTYIPENIRSEIFVINGEKSPTEETFSTLSQFNFHFCFRAFGPDKQGKVVFKPFTKGANAAACGANVLVNHESHDAVQLLGMDYPYIVKSNDDDSIVQTFNNAKTGFGGSEWLRARDAMVELKHQLSPKNISYQLKAVIQPLVD